MVRLKAFDSGINNQSWTGFNSTMVRLKAKLGKYHIGGSFSFNSTMVRLKVHYISVGHNLTLCFNSTMVRLKEKNSRNGFNSTMVRNQRKILFVFQFHNGSIKSVGHLAGILWKPSFNSTMVRLKVHDNVAFHNRIGVEFQFHNGSIKRNQLEFPLPQEQG